jgi:recombination protein RecA
MHSAPIHTPSKLTLKQRLKDEVFKNRRPFSFNPSSTTGPETIFTGIREVDQLSKGFPRGRLTEIVGPNSSGRTSLLLSTLAQVTDKEEVCALIDPAGIFDPASAAHIGVDLERLLWIRTPKPDIDQTLKATDLLIQGGGFGLIGVDFGEFSRDELCRVPPSAWFRLQRGVRNTPTILIFIGRKASTRTSASLVLGLELNRTHWTPRIFDGVCPQVEILRSRINPGINANRTPQRFFIHPAHFQAITHDPAEIFPSKNKGSNIEGVPCHEF